MRRSLSPNSWPREKTFWNIIRKIPPDSVQGSSWDPDSIMHYPFEAGLINTIVDGHWYSGNGPRSTIDATVAATDRPVTLKMRLGWDDRTLNAPELARRMRHHGLERPASGSRPDRRAI